MVHINDSNFFGQDQRALFAPPMTSLILDRSLRISGLDIPMLETGYIRLIEGGLEEIHFAVK